MTVKIEQHYCPSCGAALVAEPLGAPLRCKHCPWHLVSIAEWQAMKPFQQGYALYMQQSWPTSPLAKTQNPYAEGTPEHAEFCHGERRAVTAAQDSEE